MNMATTKKYARRAMRKAKRYGRKRDKRFPVSAGIGLGVSILAPPVSGWTTVLDAAKTGQYDKAFQSFVASWTGLRIGGIGGQANTEIDVMKTLNPFDFSYAPAWKSMLISAIVAKVVKKFAGDPISKIPFLGKYVKFA